MRYAVRHLTRVDYDAPVTLARFNLRLSPSAWPGQTVSEQSLLIDPAPQESVTLTGPYIVQTTQIAIGQPIRSISIDSRFIVDVEPVAPLLDGADAPVDTARRAALDARDAGPRSPAPYIFPSPMIPIDPEIAAWAAPIIAANAGSTRAAAMALAQAIHDQFVYDGAATESTTPAIDAFHLRRGVCQDFSHILITALRAFGIPAAYVSGYLRTLPPPGKPRLIGVDATHAWVNVWCDGQVGWVGVDPTNACFAGVNHIFTAMGRDYGDVAPVDGVFVGGAGQRQQVSVDVAPLDI